MARGLVCGVIALGCSAAGGGLDDTPSGAAGAPASAAGAGATVASGGALAAGGSPIMAGGAPGVGGAGANPGAGGSGNARPIGPLPGYDPNVRFEWPETEPGTVLCQAGHYVGTFSGFYNTLIPVAGDVNMTLTQSQNGEFLEVSDGQMSGVANLTIPFSADLQGTLDCQAKRFDAMLVNGTYDAFGAVSSFEGPFLADYDTSTHQMINGTWTVTEPNPANGGTGIWEATWTP